MRPSDSSGLSEVAGLFFRLGLTAFGGPAAHIAMMHDETVVRRKWVTDDEFMDLLGATNLIPGPNSTEMAIHLSYRRAGWPGLILGGVCFILPAMVIVTALAWAYVRYGSTPGADALLYGVKPVVIAIVAQALWALGRKAVNKPFPAVVGVTVLGLYFLGVNEIALLFGGGLAGLIGMNLARLRDRFPSIAPLTVLLAGIGSAATAAAVPYSLARLFLTFLKIGSVLYGSGYVLLAFLRADFVIDYGWLTEGQLIDAVAIGQVTPGPVFTTATFIGYVLGGLPGAVLATVGIFLPSFIFVALSNPLIPRLRGSAWAGRLLDGVNAAALGLMAAVTWQLGRAALVDLTTVALALISAVLLFRFKVNSTWLIAGGAAVGLIGSTIGLV